MGARFRADRPCHRQRPSGAAHAWQGCGGHPGRATSHRSAALRAPVAPHPAARRHRSRRTARSQPARMPETIDRLPGIGFEALDLGAIRPSRDGQHGQAAGRRRRRDPGRRDKGIGNGDRLHPALLPGRSGARRNASGCRKLAQSDCGRRVAIGIDRQPQFWQSRAARDHGPNRRRDRGHARGLFGARLPGRIRQRVALQRNQRQRDPADPGNRRRRGDRRTQPMPSTSRSNAMATL